MERRLAAIIAADVVGYSRLMRQDESGTLERLTALRREVLTPLISQHHGRIVKLMGDGLLVEFASVVDGLSCAVAWQARVAEQEAEVEEKSRLTFRIGVNLGDVIVEDEDIHGDGVNVASRLEALAEPGGICLSRTVYNHVKGKVDLSFEDLGEREVKNISEPIQVYRVRLDGSVSDTGARALQPRKPVLRWPLFAGGLAVVVALVGVALWQYPVPGSDEDASTANMAFALPDKPSIAVLPFDNFSGDPEQDYFADGITEDLITDLSKVQELFVIARNSTFVYGGHAVPVRQVAKELGVRYVLQGSVRRAGDKIRINAQLIDGKTGEHIWAERYDKKFADVFALQDEVIKQIIIELTGELNAYSENFYAENSNDPKAYDEFLIGMSHFRQNTPNHYAKAAGRFLEAVKIDPDFARAYAALAWIYWNGRYDGWYDALGISPSEAKSRADEYLKLAMSRPTALAHQVASKMALWRREYDAAISHARQANHLEPNDPNSLVALAEVLIWNGSLEEAIPLVERAWRIDPHNAGKYGLLHGRAQFHMNKFAEAAESLEASLELNPDLWNRQAICEPCVLLLSAYGYLDHEQLATNMRQRLKSNNPSYDTQINRYWFPYRRDDDFERFITGLRKAGLSL